ncbi:12292_t:CDS:1, partial [Racocetra persica]
ICSKCESWFKTLQQAYALKICQKTCLTSWHWDVNAARNIRNVFKYMCDNNGEILEAFQSLKYFNVSYTGYPPNHSGELLSSRWVDSLESNDSNLMKLW